MRITLFFFIAGLLHVSASVYSQQTNLTVRLKNASVEDVLRDIEEQSKFYFLYRSDLLKDIPKVNISVGGAKIEDILNEIIVPHGFSYEIDDRIVVIKKAGEAPASGAGATQQERQVSGVVRDQSGNPLPGVTVVIKGTAIGTITNADGNYSLGIESRGTNILVFSFVGMRPQERPVGTDRTINVTMEEETIGIEEVVAVGYGVQRKEAVTGSVVSMGGDELRSVASSNITQALQGRMPGVELSQTSSKPGAEMQIRIRGTRSLNASNDPLIVLDGIPFAGSIGDINPNDIKSLDILKDASATAVYGSRGANGVILVTTFKGQSGQRPRVNYNGYVGLKTLFAEYPMMDGPEFVKLRATAGMFNNGMDEADDVNTNWQDLLYKNSMVTSHDVGVSGGTVNGNYNVGIGYYLDEALLPEQNYQRFSLRAAIDQGIGKYFRFGLTTNSSYSISNGNNLGLFATLSTSPIANPYNEDGTLKRTVKYAAYESWVYTREIIEGLGDTWIDQTRAFGSYNTVYGEVKAPWIEGLKYRVNIGLNYRQSNMGQYTGEGVFSTTETTPSSASISNSHTINWAIENLLTFDRTFAGKHQVNVVGLYSAEETTYNKSHVSAKGILSDQFQFYNLGHANGEIKVDPVNQDYFNSGLLSWMGRVMYSYDNRYMLTATVRSDASSRLAKGHQWHTYPAVSGGWNIGNESFMKGIAQVNTLKLRVGYGETSNQAVDPYATLGRLTIRPYNFGDAYATGLFVTTLPNANLGWEYSETWNYGVDFSLLDNRLSGTIEYYTTKTKDILLSVGLPSTSGVSSFMGNIGSTQNKGFELTLHGVLLDDFNGWTWEAGVNLYANRNKLTALASGRERDESNWWFVGHPVDVVFDYEKTGLWQEADSHRDIFEPGGNAGMIKVKYTGDFNADGSPVRRIGTDDRQILSLEPDFLGGFNTRVAYKGFDLSVIGSFKSGGRLISTLHSSAGYLNTMSGRQGNVKVDYWTPENTGAKYPKPGGVMSSDNPKYGSTLGYFDASYLKVRTITLGYNFETTKWIKSAGIERLRLYCTAQNPFVLFSPYNKETKLDPETNSYGNENAAVSYSDNLKRLLTVGTNSPQARNYLIGINLIF